MLASTARAWIDLTRFRGVRRVPMPRAGAAKGEIAAPGSVA